MGIVQTLDNLLIKEQIVKDFAEADLDQIEIMKNLSLFILSVAS